MITLTERAAEQIRKQLERRGRGQGIRIAVGTAGCSGLTYKFEYCDEIKSDDETFEQYDVKVITDPKSLAYLTGTEIDWVRNGLNEGFKFNNPNVKDECGCGESFRV